jgi:hypothetical protein
MRVADFISVFVADGECADTVAQAFAEEEVEYF